MNIFTETLHFLKNGFESEEERRQREDRGRRYDEVLSKLETEVRNLNAECLALTNVLQRKA